MSDNIDIHSDEVDQLVAEMLAEGWIEIVDEETE